MENQDSFKKWTLTNISDHPVKEVRLNFTRLNTIFTKIKKDKLTSALSGVLGLVVLGGLLYFLVGRSPNPNLGSNLPANNSPIEVPATVPDPSLIDVPSGPSQVLGVTDPSPSPSPDISPSPTSSPTPTPSASPTPSPTDNPTPTPTPSPVSPSPSPSISPSPSDSPSSSP